MAAIVTPAVSGGSPNELVPRAATAAYLGPHMLRHTFVTTMLDAGVRLGDVQIVARHADPQPQTSADVMRRSSVAAICASRSG
jgi:integrase